jgi:hypothetical protein
MPKLSTLRSLVHLSTLVSEIVSLRVSVITNSLDALGQTIVVLSKHQALSACKNDQPINSPRRIVSSVP